MRKREKEWVSCGASGEKKGDWTESEEAQMSQRKWKQVHIGWLIFDGWYVRFICFSHQIHMTNTDDGRTFSAPAGGQKQSHLPPLECFCLRWGLYVPVWAVEENGCNYCSSNTEVTGHFKSQHIFLWRYEDKLVWFYASHANVTNINAVKHTQTNLFYMFPST